jgi:hypothetical protein
VLAAEPEQRRNRFFHPPVTFSSLAISLRVRRDFDARQAPCPARVFFCGDYWLIPVFWKLVRARLQSISSQ